MKLSALVLSASLLGAVPETPPDTTEATWISLCGPAEAGTRMRFEGRVLDYQGHPLSKAAVVAYHTDRTGLYNAPDSPTRMPRLRGVAVTDEAGRFGFVSIRPAPYPGGGEPAHIHLVVAAPAHQVRPLEIWFDDDPLVTKAHRERAASSESTVIVRPVSYRGEVRFSFDVGLTGD